MLRRIVFLFGGLLALAALVECSSLAFLVLDTRIAQPGRLPDGWHIKVNRGSPDIKVIPDAQGSVLRLKSRASSFALERGVDIDPARYPYLAWRWKVTEVPREGDFRHVRTDDQAAQVLVAFGDRRILAYIWDSNAPKDTFQSASNIPLLHLFALVCRSGQADLNQWLTEVRNVSADYERAFGRPPARHVKGIRIQINSQHTGASAESYFGDVGFRSTL
jgi:Protein of unknown function (DUF3047)